LRRFNTKPLSNVAAAAAAGLKKLEKYKDIADENETYAIAMGKSGSLRFYLRALMLYYLTVCHPGIRLSWLTAKSAYYADLYGEHFREIYRDYNRAGSNHTSTSESHPAATAASAPLNKLQASGSFLENLMTGISLNNTPQPSTPVKEETTRYLVDFEGPPCSVQSGAILEWWKVSPGLLDLRVVLTLLFH
jgi:hypothetical protein